VAQNDKPNKRQQVRTATSQMGLRSLIFFPHNSYHHLRGTSSPGNGGWRPNWTSPPSIPGGSHTGCQGTKTCDRCARGFVLPLHVSSFSFWERPHVTWERSERFYLNRCKLQGGNPLYQQTKVPLIALQTVSGRLVLLDWQQPFRQQFQEQPYNEGEKQHFTFPHIIATSKPTAHGVHTFLLRLPSPRLARASLRATFTYSLPPATRQQEQCICKTSRAHTQLEQT